MTEEQKTQQQLVSFYVKQALETGSGLQKKVFEANNMALNPTTVAELKPVPVYETEGYECCLLTQANIGRKITTISWPETPVFEYLPAYYKRFRNADGKFENKIVVNTANYCEARFFSAKELMHCFLDDDGAAACNSIPLVNQLMESLAVGWNITEADLTPQRIVDEVAYLAAVEYLIPAPWIPLLNKVREQIVAADSSLNAFLHVAQLIRVPEHVLRVKLRTTTTP